MLGVIVWAPSAVLFGQKGDEDLKIETRLVSVEISVTESDGKPVTGLRPEDIRLFVNGSPTDVAFFQPVVKEANSRPISIVFALDMSGSVTSAELELLTAAMRRFVDQLSRYDAHFALVTFGMDVKTVQSFTARRDKIEKAFRKLAREDDGLSTHAYDAIDSAVRLLVRKSPKVIKGKFPRRAIIVITDGFPVGDTVSPATAAERANQAETSVFGVILPSFSRLQGKKKPLPTLLEASGLIEKTGGRSFYANELNFERLFDQLATEIVSSYVVAYYPDDSATQEIRVEAPNGLRVTQSRKTVNRTTDPKPDDQ